MSLSALINGEVISRMAVAQARYGAIVSTHEGLGVATEEYAELIEAVRSNDMAKVAKESLDLAAICLRLAMACHSGEITKRSTK